MKLILDIEDKRAPFVMELLKSFNYIHILNEINDPKKGKIIKDLDESFRDVQLHTKGKKKLKSTKDLLNEL